MRVLVCGSRDYRDARAIQRELDKIHAETPITQVVHGAQRGVDLFAENWARDRGIEYVGVPAKWKLLGKRAGPIRNERMLTAYQPELVIAFPGGKGTRNMTEQAIAAGIAVKMLIPLPSSFV